MVTITPTQTKVYGPDWRYGVVQAQHLYQTNRDWRFSETEFLVMDLILAKALLASDVCPDLGAEIHIRRQVSRRVEPENQAQDEPSSG